MSSKVLIVGADSFLGKSLYIKLLNDSSFNVLGTSRKPDHGQYLDLNERHQINFTDYDIVIFVHVCIGLGDYTVLV